MENAHSAMGDTIGCEAIYWKMKDWAKEIDRG